MKNEITTVELQEPFSYALWPIFLLGGIILAFLAFFIISHILKVRKQRKLKEPKKTKLVDKDSVKTKYLGELDKIESQYNKGNISVRIAYQRMSSCIRSFVYEVTGIKVHKLTLSEIQSLQLPMLYELIKEYYPPEFDKDSTGDVVTSLNKAKEVIQLWN